MERDSPRADDKSGPEQLMSEPSLEAFFELSRDLVCVAGLDGFFKRINPAFERVLGHSKEELLSQGFLAFVHPDDRESTINVMGALARGEPTVSFSNRYRCADGTYKWMQWNCAPDAASQLIYAVARETTDLKLDEERLRAHERQLVEAQATAGVGSSSRDLTTGVLTWSEEMYRLLGLTPFAEAPTIELYVSCIPEAERSALVQIFVSAGDEPYSLEHGLRGVGGELRTVLLHVRTIKDERGSPIRRIATVQDVTSRVRAEQESRFLARVTHAIATAPNVQQALLTTLSDLCETRGWDYGEFWFPRSDQTVLECAASHAREATAELSQFKARSEARTCAPLVTLPGRVWIQGSPEWHADLASAGDDVFCRFDLAQEAKLRTCVGLPMVVEGKVVAVLVLLRQSPTPEDTQQLSVLRAIMAQLGILLKRKQAEDALRESELRYQLAALATDDVIYDWDIATNMLDVNEGMARNYGYPVRRVSIDWWGELLHKEDYALAWPSLFAAIEGDAKVWTGEYRFLRADGSWANVVDRGYLIRDDQGKVRRMIGSMMDITDRVRAAEVLREAKETAEAAGRAKSEFLANMSHEIRTPLTAVLGFADLLLDPKLGESERLNYAMTIRRNGEHLLNVLNDILDFSKIEAGKLQLESIACSPAQLLTDVASLMRVRAVEKGLSFEVEYASAIPAEVRTDPTRVRQIVLNLVSNAIKFTPQGGVRLRAECHDGAVEGQAELVVAVKDTGIGISPEQQEKLFKPFSQADASMSRRYGGSGLGLGICAPLASALGGAIEVQSELGAGSTFVLRIPVGVDAGTPRVLDLAEALTTDAALPSVRSSSETRIGGLVLLAEDGRDNQVLISRLLRKHDFEVTVVSNGRLAVDHARRALEVGRPYDVILMDMQMPELDGYGATAELRARDYVGPILALTAHAMQGERERCFAAGCNAYLTKPVDRAALIATVQEYVAKARHERASMLPEPPRSTQVSSDSRRGDEGRLVSEYADDPDIADIVAAFIEGLPATMAQLEAAFARGDQQLVQRLSHQLKGAAGGYGFPLITESAARAESLAHATSSPEALRDALASLRAVCDRAAPCAPVVDLHHELTPLLLAIDDSPQIHNLVEARLRSEGVEILRALTAEEGLRVARERAPDLVLLDLDLPDANGLDVCRKLKADPSTATTPVIFLTGSSDVRIKAQALDLGAIDYVTKPFDAIELRARVRSALRTKRYLDLLQNRAQLDGLTGLWNRAYFDARLHEEESACLRHGRLLSLVMVDIDHFKQVNDTYGHPMGDQLLQLITRALRKAVRGNDIVCRYGGEEFGLILRDTAGASAAHVAERVRRAIEEIALTVRGQRVPVSASLGVASIEAKPVRNGGFAAALLSAADAALYSAKRAGRNRVVSVLLECE